MHVFAHTHTHTLKTIPIVSGQVQEVVYIRTYLLLKCWPTVSWFGVGGRFSRFIRRVHTHKYKHTHTL